HASFFVGSFHRELPCGKSSKNISIRKCGIKLCLPAGASTPKRSAKELVDRAASAAEKSKRKLTHKAQNRLIHSAASEYGVEGCLPEDVVGAAQPREVLMDEPSESAETGTVEGMQGTLGIFSMV
ncbi:hypothetical protein FOZ63_032895, partial [Perkinsus olseni]